MKYLQGKHKRRVWRFSGVFPLSLLAVAIAGSLPAQAGKFDPRFLEDVGGANKVADLSMYDNDKTQQLPGSYRVDVVVNDTPLEPRMVSFSSATPAQAKALGESLYPCISRTQLAEMGVRVEQFPLLMNAPAEACVPFTDIIPGATSQFDFNHQALHLSIPQAAMQQTARGTVPESRWDQGIAALLLDYSFSGSNGSNNTDYSRRDYIDDRGNEHTDENGGRSYNNSYYANLRGGANLGAWRLRNNSTWSRNDGQANWDNLGTYLTRNVAPLKSQVTLGDTSTPGDIFDSVQMRGALLASDDEMYPDSQRGFAPIVRGIASTNAEVVIEQNGYVIYRSFVQPGAFEISDLYPTSSSGDLTVTVKEADGREQHFVQPFSAVAIFQREGHLKYSLSAGEYRGGNYQSGAPNFTQSQLIYGLTHGFTGYGGALLSADYASVALGIGKNLGEIGAVSVDVTQANSQLDDERSERGQSYRFLYAKSFAGSGTDFRLLGYKYSTQGYYTFQEATDVRAQADSDYARYHKRSQIQGNLTQQLGDLGSVYLNLTLQDYWQDQGNQRTVSTGYNGRIKSLSWSVAYNYTQSPDYDEADRMLSLSFSLPLGRAWSSYRMTSDQDGRTSQQVGVSGTLLEQGNLNYSVQEGYGSHDVGNSGSASLGYQGRSGNVDAGYNYSRDSQQVNYGLRGGVVMHSEGITLSQPLGETMVLVNADGAKGTGLSNNGSVAIDRFGNAIVPYVSPYRETEVALRSDTLGENVDISDPIQRVVPTRGAVVRARFNTHVGYRALLTLSRPGNNAVPFGATAVLKDKQSKNPLAGIVGEEGELYMSGLPDSGELKISWGKAASQQCTAAYQLPQDKTQMAAVIALNAVCQ
ncbi:outer membrane usher protein FimD [Enterobacterales bacterium]|nr:outer membrane usher protein FimD [Enterobacterales bacterium]